MIELYVIAFLGFVLHFVGRWGEYTRAVAKVSPWAYVMQDPPAWIAAVIGAVIAVMLVPDVSAVMVAMEVPQALHDKMLSAARLVYFLAGYAGSSIVAKVPGWIFPAVSRPDQR